MNLEGIGPTHLDRIGAASGGVSKQSAVRRTESRSTDSLEASRGAAADSVEISDEARALARAQEAVRAAPEVRTEKVARIKRDIETGTYSVPAELLARKLLGDV